jgi:hypothetical protein
MKKSSDTPITLICCGGARFYEYAHKKGEVVGPAGGETGVPRCLAEVRKLLACSFISLSSQGTQKKSTPIKKPVKQKMKSSRA